MNTPDNTIPAEVVELAEDIADHCGSYVNQGGVDYIAERLHAAILAERERCALVALAQQSGDVDWDGACTHVADCIRDAT